MSKNDGGKAFPETRSTGYLVNSMTAIESIGGMSLRDYFAAKALQSYLTAMLQPNIMRAFEEMSDTTLNQHAAMKAYEAADAMLKERTIK